MCDVIMAHLWKALAFLNVALVAGDVLIYPKGDPFMLLQDFFDQEANFGMDIPKRGISTGVVVASNEHACDPIQPPPTLPNPPTHWAVLIRRYNCTFEQKVLNAQNAFYDVAIVHNVDSNALEIMNASHPEQIHIMAIFISANSGKEIRTKYLYEQGFYVEISSNSSNDILGKIIIPFIVVISASFLLMLGFMVVKCIKDYRRARRRRMPWSTLNRIPTTKYRKNDPYETCAICLDDFIEGEKLRVLPCSHAYHSKCIDPWLTRNRRVCPLCKRKVFAADERVESDGSSSEDDDHTPLLRGRNLNTRIALAHAEHMRNLLATLQRTRDEMPTTERRWSSSGTSSSSSTSSNDNGSSVDQGFQQVIRSILIAEGLDLNGDGHQEDHHQPSHDQPRTAESREGSNVDVHVESAHQEGHGGHADGNHHNDGLSHDEVHESHYTHDDVHDSHYDHDDSHHEVTFHDDSTYDHSHDYDC